MKGKDIFYTIEISTKVEYIQYVNAKISIDSTAYSMVKIC